MSRYSTDLVRYLCASDFKSPVNLLQVNGDWLGFQ